MEYVCTVSFCIVKIIKSDKYFMYYTSKYLMFCMCVYMNGKHYIKYGCKDF